MYDGRHALSDRAAHLQRGAFTEVREQRKDTDISERHEIRRHALLSAPRSCMRDWRYNYASARQIVGPQIQAQRYR